MKPRTPLPAIGSPLPGLPSIASVRGGASPRPVGAIDRWLGALLQKRLRNAPVRLALWDGSSAYDSAVPPVATVAVKDRPTLIRLVRNPDVAFGEAFTAGRLDVRGDLVRLLETVFRASVASATAAARGWTAPWHGSNTRRGSRANVHHHYDLGNEFYQLWLDRELVYTCAYFPTPSVTLEEAQVAKMDHVCRKLRLRPGERVVEAGCGWGALALHMARRYGVSVKAFNVSQEQIRYARRRANEEGLADRVEFIEDDYRNIRGTFDAFVSVGMLEHVGLEQYGALAAVIDRTLRPDRGRGLLHFIGRTRSHPLNPWIGKHIFPGAYPPTLGEVTERIVPPVNLSVLDVENLRLHYALTLKHWLARYETAADRVAVMFGEPFVRLWRLYLAGSQAAFTTGWLQLFQVVFARGSDNSIPWTRADHAAV